MLVGELKAILSHFDDNADVSIIDYDQNNCWDIIEWRTCEDHSSEDYFTYLDLVMGTQLDVIKKAIEEENISYSEILYLQDHQKEVLATGDPLLCQWAGITEQEYLKGKLGE